MTRDYARLVIELALDRGVLPCHVLIDRCRPPYFASPPLLQDDYETVKSHSEEIGGYSILSSCETSTGDFGRYVIKGRVENFSTLLLGDAPPPISPDADWTEKCDLKRKLTRNASPGGLWIAERAFSLGWTKKSFPRDGALNNGRQSGGRIERVGKKYQRIAFNELLARLADNYWIIDDFRSPMLFRYDTPNDIPFVRDIEITLPIIEDELSPLIEGVSPEISAMNVPSEGEEALWVFDDGVPENWLRQATREDGHPDDWSILYRRIFSSVTWPEGEHSVFGFDLRQNEFAYQMMIGAKRGSSPELARKLREAKRDFHDWIPENRTDLGYLYEIGVRKTWDEGLSGPEKVETSENEKFRQFTVGYHWERHLDRTIPGGFELEVPSAWLVKRLGLTADAFRPGIFRNENNRIVIVCRRSSKETVCLIRRSELEEILNEEDLEPAWVGFGERSTYPRRDSGIQHHRRRWNGILSPEAGDKVYIWVDDKSHHAR